MGAACGLIQLLLLIGLEGQGLGGLGARPVLPDVLASAAGIGLSALVNFAVQDRLTLRRRTS